MSPEEFYPNDGIFFFFVLELARKSCAFCSVAWINVLLKCTWNFLQNRRHTGSQMTSEPIPKDSDHPLHILRPYALKLELNHNKKFGRTSNTWRLRTILLGIPGWRSGLAPAFGPGRDPGDPGSNPTSGSRCMEPASLSLSLSLWLS